MTLYFQANEVTEGKQVAVFLRAIGVKYSYVAIVTKIIYSN